MAEFQIYSSPPHSLSPKRQKSSPNRADADFYRRKTERLEEDLMTIGDELNKARIRLRRAEDFQIKYDILFKQKSALEEDNIKKEKDLFDLRSRNEEMSLAIRERGARSEETNYEKQHLLKEIELWKQKVVETEEKIKLAIIEEENRATEKISKEIMMIKRNFAEAEEEYKFQVSRLTSQLNEKSHTDNNVYEKNEKLKKEREHEISRLEKVVHENRDEFLKMVETKNGEISKIKDKFQQIFNNEIGQLQKNMSSQDENFRKELGSLKSLIDIKNDEIANLQSEMKANLESYTREREEFNSEIQLLKEKIYDRDRINEQELYNMKERLISLHAIDIDAIKSHYEQLIDGLKQERKEMEKVLANKDEKIIYELKEFERGKNDLNSTIESQQKRIEELLKTHSKTGQNSNTEIANLQETLSKQVSEKEALNNEYQANITFLNQQITKLISSNQLKNNEIRELHEYNALLKKEHFQSLKDLENKWKNERKEREAEREKERDLRENIQEEYREKEKAWRNKEREIERNAQKERREKNKWILNHDKLEKQIERLLKQNSDLELSNKTLFGKTQKTVISTGEAKRELVNELERQRVDIEARKRMDVDQVKKQFELQLTRLAHQNEKLQNELVSKQIQYQKLEEEFRKVSSQYKNIEKINKEKLVDYHKKMATLNSEILLTQNLYQSFIEAKSKVKRSEA